MALREDKFNLVGDKIGDYRIKRFIDCGGYSFIYQAQAEGNGNNLAGGKEKESKNSAAAEEQDVVIKLLDRCRYQNPFYLSMSIHENKVLSELNHPGVIKSFGSFFVNHEKINSHYLVLEYFPYQDLQTHMENYETENWKISKKIKVVLEASRALEYIHNKGIAHLDIKPQNILCNEEKIKVIDFFLAKYTNGRGLNPPKEQGVVYGTTHFLSPESLKGDEGIHSDIFALGLVFNCLLLDVDDPYLSLEYPDVIRMISGEEPFVFHENINCLPAVTRPLISGMTQFNFRNRPTASEVVSELEKILGE